MPQPPDDAKPAAALAAVSRLAARSVEGDGAANTQPTVAPHTSPIAPPAAQSAGPAMPPAVRQAEVELSNLPKIIRFDALARCGDEIWIENEGQIYRLRKTRQGKLILTK
jgi:hemin uptake protein HemP